MKHKFEVRQMPEDGLRNPGKWTFSVDDRESLFYSDTEDGIRRVVGRLKQGRTRENRNTKRVGTSEVPRVAVTETDDGKFCACLDGQDHHHEFNTADEARCYCAIEAFLTRGKLGRKAEVEAAMNAHPDLPDDGVFTVQDGRICVECESTGERYGIVFEKPDEGEIGFKKLQPVVSG